MAGRKAFVDSSAVLRPVLRQPGAITGWRAWTRIFASELMPVEGQRALDRLRVMGQITPGEYIELAESFREAVAAVTQLPLSRAILRRAAGPLSAPLGTLDAIHLATALQWAEENGETPVLLTHDRQLAIAARACGLDVHP